MKAILFSSVKGGVGRTTVSGNVAAALARQGARTAWVTAADGDWAKVENLTVFSATHDAFRQAVNDAQNATADGVVVVDLPACDPGPAWWTGEGEVVLVTDGQPASLYGALETARAWRYAQHAPAGFVLAQMPSGGAGVVAAQFRKAVSQFASLKLVLLGATPTTPESASLVNIGRFCTGKAAAPYAALAKRLSADRESSGDKADVLGALRGLRDKVRAA